MKKLNRAQASERHLLVWIHADFHQLTAAMGMGGLPDRDVFLGDEIDAVWVASAYERPTVWRFDKTGWTDLTHS